MRDMTRLHLVCVTVCVAVVLLTGSTCEAAKILFLFPLSYKSHVILMEPLIKALGERGHDLLVLTPVPLSLNMPKRVEQVQLLALNDIYFNMTSDIELRQSLIIPVPFLMYQVQERINQGCVGVLTHPYVHNVLLGRQAKFDLVIVDILTNQCVLGLLPYFDAASIHVVTTAAFPSYIANTVGNRWVPSFVPTLLLPLSEKMSFTERMLNTVWELIIWVGVELYLLGTGERMYRNYLPNGSGLPSINDIRQNVSMIFVNSHIALNSPMPLLSNVIQIGGLHTRPATELPQDLEEFMNVAGQDGVILFSMGSRGAEMPEKIRQVFVNVFSKLKQRVVWRWNGEMMHDVPPNVLLRKWLPQQDVLGHPNIKLFLTHAGILSLQEAVYHGVPVIGFPAICDTDANIKQAEYLGYGKIADIINLNEKSLEGVIREVLTNASFREKVKQLSELMRDVPQNPLDTAVFWTEYVLRHKGAPHLSSAAKDLNFFQYYLLDVIAVFLAGIISIAYFTIKFCKATQKLSAVGCK